jgi:hypothetical protein
MARVDIGNDLLNPVLAPGWKLTDDGFGLRTITATFNYDIAQGFTFVRGTPFVEAAYNYLKLHKQTAAFNALGVQVMTCEYVGIAPEVHAGDRTNPNTSAANGLTSENITSHPNFFVPAAGFLGGALAGLPGDFGGAYDDSTLGPVVNRYNTVTGKTVSVPSCEGYYGACFEQPNGGRFIGFVDPDYPTVYGKTQYLATTTTYSGVVYMATTANVTTLLGYLGTATAGLNFGVVNLLPSWAPIGTTAWGNKNLLSQVNVEEYGLLYKVMYEIRYSSQGWDSGVYKPA